MLHQIQVAIYHPEVSKKTLLSVLDSKMTPFWSHVTPDPGGDLPSRGVPKRDPQNRTLLGVPVFGPVLPRSSCNLPQNMVPGPKSTFWTHVTPDPGGDLPSRGVQKGAPFGPRLQNDPFWSHVTPYPGGDLPSRGVPKRGPQKCYAFWGPRFGIRFAQILTQFV